MFLSNAAVPVIAFFLLFNVLYLFSPIESGESGWIFQTCEDCLADKCHTDDKRPCYTRWDAQYNFTCFLCPPQDGNEQFFTEDDCKECCKDETKECVCDSACYMCVAKDFDKSNLTECYIPDPSEVTCQ